MLETLYLAETSQTYRELIPKLMRGYVREVIDLWEDPQTPIETGSPERLVMVDEAFVMRGPGPARMILQNLLDPRKIFLTPVILMTRREQYLREVSSRVFRLRRPFRSEELEGILNSLCPSGRIFSEVSMTENVIVPPALDNQKLEELTREAIEKAVRELVPAMAEKMIQDEIRRLTE